MHYHISAWNAVHVNSRRLHSFRSFSPPQGHPQCRVRRSRRLRTGFVPSAITLCHGSNGVALPLHALPEYEKEGAILVDRCERLYSVFPDSSGEALKTLI